MSNSSGDFREARADVLEILEYALERAQPEFTIQRAVRVEEGTLWLDELPIDLGEVKRVFVIVKRGSAQKARKIRIITGSILFQP